MKEKLERIIHIRPAFDKRHPDPKKDYGIHGAEMLFILKGEEGAVQFVLYTNWHLPHVREEQDKRILAKARGTIPRRTISKISGPEMTPETLGKMIRAVEEASGRVPGVLDQTDLNVTYHPIPADLGYHSPKPMYEGHKPIGSTWVDTKAMTRNLEKMTDAQRLGIEPEECEEVSFPTGVADPCEWLDGKPCYYDGSGLNAEPIYRIMLEKGSDGVWEELEKYYEQIFRKEE